MKMWVAATIEAVVLLLAATMLLGALVIGLWVSSARKCDREWGAIGPTTFVFGQGCMLLVDGKWHSVITLYRKRAQDVYRERMR